MLVLFLPGICLGQKAQDIRGYLFYQDNQKPVVSALVSIVNMAGYETFTNKKGEFSFKLPKDVPASTVFKIQISLPDNEIFEFETLLKSSVLQVPIPHKLSSDYLNENSTPETPVKDTTMILPKYQSTNPQLNTDKLKTAKTTDKDKISELQSQKLANQADSNKYLTINTVENKNSIRPQEDISDLKKDFDAITRKIEIESQNIISGSENIKKDILQLWDKLKLKKNLSNQQRDTLRQYLKNLDKKIKDYTEANQSSQNNVLDAIQGLQKVLNVQESQIRINRITIITLTAIIFGLSLLSYIFYLINQRTQRQKKILAENIRKINQQNEEINQQQEEIKLQSDAIRLKNRELEFAYNQIKDSVQYAQRIQSAFLVNPQKLEYYFKDSFILHIPKDIVSGDFYWHSFKNDMLLIAVIDCTGHGVPGALMTIMANDALDQIVNEKNIIEPIQILEELDFRVQNALGEKMDDEGETKDGMDLMIARLDFKNQQISVSGAGSTMYYVRDQKIHQIKGSKYILGRRQNNEPKVFTEEIIYLKGEEIIYLFSDGFQDQFGGMDDSKYLKTRFRDFLHTISPLPLQTQKERLEKEFNRWKNEHPQTDDVLVLGLKL
ncbi:MAG: SpoIIE family protein phosphatase [Microscillaceae bacterium]|nr:SpoIIE family protein phosphatase [Microscillaceae bacterium]